MPFDSLMFFFFFFFGKQRRWPGQKMKIIYGFWQKEKIYGCRFCVIRHSDIMATTEKKSRSAYITLPNRKTEVKWVWV